MTSIGERIRAARKAKGMTQAELAERTGYTSRSTIAKIEAGVNDIPQSQVAEFAEALGCTVAYLMGREEILVQLGQDGKARQVWKTEIYFDSEAERDEFDRKLTEGWCPLEWIDAEVELPVTEETVLCVVTGDYGNLRFCGAIEMARWSDQDGWILEAFPDIVNPGVTHWMELPEGPGEAE